MQKYNKKGKIFRKCSTPKKENIMRNFPLHPQQVYSTLTIYHYLLTQPNTSSFHVTPSLNLQIFLLISKDPEKLMKLPSNIISPLI